MERQEVTQPVERGPRASIQGTPVGSLVSEPSPWSVTGSVQLAEIRARETGAKVGEGTPACNPPTPTGARLHQEFETWAGEQWGPFDGVWRWGGGGARAPVHMEISKDPPGPGRGMGALGAWGWWLGGRLFPPWPGHRSWWLWRRAGLPLCSMELRGRHLQWKPLQR